MHLDPDPYVQRLLVQDRHADLRRAAHRSRLRRDARRARRRD